MEFYTRISRRISCRQQKVHRIEDRILGLDGELEQRLEAVMWVRPDAEAMKLQELKENRGEVRLPRQEWLLISCACDGR